MVKEFLVCEDFNYFYSFVIEMFCLWVLVLIIFVIGYFKLVIFKDSEYFYRYYVRIWVYYIIKFRIRENIFLVGYGCCMFVIVFGRLR